MSTGARSSCGMRRPGSYCGMANLVRRHAASRAPSRRYRVRVIYDNPTGRTISAGGMGVVGGLFMPQRDAVWPKTDPGDSLYQQDLRHFMGAAGSMAPMH